MTSLCPFCRVELINSVTNCPNNKKLPCQECAKCHSYFYSKANYDSLKNLAIKNKRKLNSNVYYFSESQSIFKTHPDSKLKKNKTGSNINNNKKNIAKKKSKKEKLLKPLLKVAHDLPLTNVQISKSKSQILQESLNCKFYKKGFCVYIDNNCNPLSVKCINIFKENNTYNSNPQEKINASEKTLKNNNIDEIVVTAIVLSDNRKCTYGNHNLKDIIAKINIVTPNGKIKLLSLPAVYCCDCLVYFVLKRDFEQAKLQGVILCRVEDRTSHYLHKHANQKFKTVGESEIHKMGYNVRKDFNYTEQQRHVILANIIENTKITKHQVLSVIDAGIARHKSKQTHQQAVQRWLSDREFILNYKTGDLPEVLISDLVLKYNK